MALTGIRHYTGDETSNILLGQTGFKIITAAGGILDVTTLDNIEQFPVIKILVDGTMKGETFRGDHFTLDGTEGGGAITVEAGESYYAPFKKLQAIGACVIAAYMG